MPASSGKVSDDLCSIHGVSFAAGASGRQGPLKSKIPSCCKGTLEVIIHGLIIPREDKKIIRDGRKRAGAETQTRSPSLLDGP